MGVRILPMKGEQEIATRLANLREQLTAVKYDRKTHAKKTGAKRTTLGIRSLRLLEGEIAGLAWVLGVPDPGPTPTVQ